MKEANMVVVLPCLLFLLLSSPLGRAAAYSAYSCNATIGNYTANDAFGANLARLTSELPINASTSPSLYASAVIGIAPDRAFGLALCRGDITDAETCSGCLDDAFLQLRRLCAGDRDATFYHDLCTLRYSADDFLARPDDNSPVINAMEVNGSTYADWDSQNATSREYFLPLVGSLFGEMALYGAYNSTVRRFASAVMYIKPEMPTVYGLAQCTPDLSPGQCMHCFQGLEELNKQWYDGREGGRILGVRCNFRYEGYQFYAGTPDVRIGFPPSGNGNNHNNTHSCNATIGKYTASDAFGANLARLTTELPINASTSPSLYASAVIGIAPDRAFGLALCRGDITDAKTCSVCLKDAFLQLRQLCAGDRDATFYHDLCTLRYSADDFLARPDDNSPVINAMEVNGSMYADWDSQNATSRDYFLRLVGSLFAEMALYGAYNSTVRRFASAVMYIRPEMPTVYGLAQCTPDLSPGQCSNCFQGLDELNRKWYDGREGGRILGVRCNFRYEGYQFYAGTPSVRIGFPPSGNGSNHKKILVIVICVSITVFCFMLVGCLLLVRRQRKGAGEMKSEQAHSGSSLKTDEALALWKIEESSSEFTVYDFAELGAATDNFSQGNKLGTGGFGPVYKGILPDGTEVAVKRLAAQSGQGFDEFKNEIQLIAKLQHTNLVKLVGCCVQEEEKMLAYEYMPNRSLDFFIFDQERGLLLNWKRRLHIIEGIAQGLIYLHKHSRVRIVHRDMKASNVLLDKDLNPKISDFGMARIFSSNVTQANTNRIVGTYGYMAPEYASEGIFSDKSDVFSFGVLLLEIVSGKRNSGDRRHYGEFVNLLGHAWQLWREGRGFELVDQTPGDFDKVTSMLRCIHVALLCVQDNAMDRPTMADATMMLGNAGVPLPDPKQPPHFYLRVAVNDEEDGVAGSGVGTQSTHLCSTNDMTISTIQEGR